jgi:hypothetical protein
VKKAPQNVKLKTVFKGTVAPVPDGLQVVWMERSKSGEERLEVYEISLCFFNF